MVGSVVVWTRDVDGADVAQIPELRLIAFIVLLIVFIIQLLIQVVLLIVIVRGSNNK